MFVEYYMPKEENAEEVKKEEVKPITLTDLPGIAEKTAEKLVDAGFDSVESIAASSIGEIKELVKSEKVAKEAIKVAREATAISFVPASELPKIRPERGVTTGSKDLDKFLGGGIPAGVLTAVESPYGTGKSQLGMQLCVNVQLPEDKGGLGGKAVVIDSEKGFKLSRLKQMAKAAKLDPEEIARNVLYNFIYNTDHMLLNVEKLATVIPKENVKLIEIDSFTGPFRADFIGREDLPARSRKMRRIMNTLLRLADKYNIPVYLTGQVMGQPTPFGGPIVVAGGETFKHLANIHVELKKSKGEKRIATLTKHPNRPSGIQCVFAITEKGIQNIEKE